MDLDELCSALGDSSYEHQYYLDLATGEILLVSDYMDEEERDRFFNNIDEEPERYERIPRLESYEG